METSLTKTKHFFAELVQAAGITINGNNPWDIQIHHPAFYDRILQENSIGLGESYMDHWWDCNKLDEFFYRLLRANLDSKTKPNARLLIKLMLARFINFQTKYKSLRVGKQHYDIGNSLFERMLDHRLNYTCGYWKNAADLETAQLAKLKLVCDKLALQPGMRVLDIGCGWGSFAKYAAIQYGVSVVGVTISEQQCLYAKESCQGLPIEIRFQDYRDVQGTFDRIVSLGMFEHVGHLNYCHFMTLVHRCLAEEGLFLLHTIGSNKTLFKADEWISKYIFPSGMLPSISQIGKSIEGLFIMEDWHNFGADYDKTLMAWHQNFNQHWEEIKIHYDDRFFRMWNYYLLQCAGGFRSRSMQLWQIVLSKKGILGGYQSIR